MKSVIFFLFLIVNPIQDEFRLNGKYKFIPQEGEIYYIDFNDSVYVKTSSMGVANRGIIQYGKNLIYLVDYERTLKMKNSHLVFMETDKLKEMDLIALKTGRKDSIEYSHHAYREGGPTSWLHFTDEQGKLIKVK